MPTLETLKALADETRLRIVNILASAGELDSGAGLCACEIEAVLGLTQSNASRHLAKLRSAGLVRAERHGLWVHYELARLLPHTAMAESFAESAREEDERFRKDLARLRDYRSSAFTCETIAEWVEADA